MSAETKAALEVAVAAHVADTGGVLGAYILIAEATSIVDLDDDMSRSLYESSGSAYTQRGLVEAWRDQRMAMGAGE